MNTPFDFDFDKAEEEIKKEKEKLEKPGVGAFEWTTGNLYYSMPNFNGWLSEFPFRTQPKQFGKVYLENENFRVKQDCSFCKNNIQSKINICRKCKIRDRRNTQSNFVLDKNKEIQPRFKLNQIWNSVFSELDD